MKYLPTALALVCAVLVISLIVTKRGDNAQYENDAGAIADLSNTLDAAQSQLAVCSGTILSLSNSLDEARSVSSALSNQMTSAAAAVALDTEQISNLNRQVAEKKSENQTLQTTSDQRVMDLTNQMAGLTRQMTLTRSNLDQANQDYALLENRLRRDVAERVVVERKFNNLPALQAEMQNLEQGSEWNPPEPVSAESIYAGLDVEVTSNSFHVIAPK